jgi:hypothetical protein
MKTKSTAKYNLQYEMTKVKKKRQFVTRGYYTSIANFLDKKVPRYRAEYLEYFCFISKLELICVMISRGNPHDVLRKLGWETPF